MAGIRIDVRRGDAVIEVGTVRAAGTGATAGKTARPAEHVQGAFARAREVRCA